MRIPSTKELELFAGLFKYLLIAIAMGFVYYILTLPARLLLKLFQEKPDELHVVFLSLTIFIIVAIILFNKLWRAGRKKITPNELDRKKIKEYNDAERVKILQLSEPDKENKLKRLHHLKEISNKRVKEIISNNAKIPLDRIESSSMIWELKISEPLLRKIVTDVENEFGLIFPVHYAQTVNSVSSFIRSVNQKLNYRIRILERPPNK